MSPPTQDVSSDEAPPSSRVRGGTLHVLAAPPSEDTRPSPARRRLTTAGTLLLVSLGLALPAIVAHLLRPDTAASDLSTARPAPQAPPAPRAETPPATGPVRLCVLRFRNLGGTPALAPLELALAEALVTDVGAHPGFRLIERGQMDLNLEEQDFSQGARVDPATRARLGRIAGAEVVILGSIQQAGDVLRVAARFVHVETGEVLETVRVEGPVGEVLALQDSLAARVRELLPRLPGRLRP
ncbi:CsgG/HfaB family protein [Myxococcus dinghuensis]|uniref:CsgG/HfaB family protein n=1 Tax=Myxococcus dinghuensis TaxID=2906761 RepID=UPI0020A6FB5B|nr:CsgG/HfaB family protein [Myxococcus dinghuensis]